MKVVIDNTERDEVIEEKAAILSVVDGKAVKAVYMAALEMVTEMALQRSDPAAFIRTFGKDVTTLSAYVKAQNRAAN